MSYEVIQLRYLFNTNNVLWSQSTWISDRIDQISKLTDFIGHFLCWSDIQVDWLHRTLFVLNRYLSWMTSYDIVYVAQIFKFTEQCSMKSVNLDIWSTQTMSNEVSQLGYLINTNNVLWSQSTWISDQHKHCPMKSVNFDFIRHCLCWSDIQVDWLHRTLFVLIRYPSWLTS
jgi:hypothetical protein